MADHSPLLEVHDLRAGYGALPVLHGVSFAVEAGETAVILGLNGAGKTTMVLNLCGVRQPWSGTIRFDGADVTGWTARQAVARGVAMVPEGRHVFRDLTVERNLLVGAWSHRRAPGWFEEQRDRVFERFPRLRERRTQRAGDLSGGEQQMLALGRGLMSRPRLLVIDEASLGLAPVLVEEVLRIVEDVNAAGVTVVLVEQNMSALQIADVALVLQQGVIVDEVRGRRLRDPAAVRGALLG